MCILINICYVSTFILHNLTNIDLSRSYAHFCKKYIRKSRDEENCIKSDLASYNTVYAHIRREPNMKTTLYILYLYYIFYIYIYINIKYKDRAI